MQRRDDDFAARRGHLAGLTDEELAERFWHLADELVSPLLELGRDYTSPSIERSVLLRMGLSSLQAKAVVDGCVERGILGHGAGNLVYRLSRKTGLSIADAGVGLAEGRLWDETAGLFEGGAAL